MHAKSANNDTWKKWRRTLKYHGIIWHTFLVPKFCCSKSCVSPRGVACLNIDPNRVRKLLGVYRGGVRGVGRSTAEVPGGGGGAVVTSRYVLQNEPNDAVSILNIHSWGKTNFRKKIARMPRLPISQGLTHRSGPGSKLFFGFFTHF